VLAEWIWDNVEHDQILETLEAPTKGFGTTSKRSFSNLTSYSQMKHNKAVHLKYHNDQTELDLIEEYWTLLKEAQSLDPDESAYDHYYKWKDVEIKLHMHQKKMMERGNKKENELRKALKHAKNGERVERSGRYYDSDKIATAQAALDKYLGEKRRTQQRNESKKAIKLAKTKFFFVGKRSTVYKSTVLK
jgi:hypothetical protein